jgi:glucose/arabinose dehydrogenase
MKNFILSAALISTALADPRQPEFYLREEIPMPEGEVLELGSIAIMPDKKVAVSSRRGDVWICEGAYEKDLSKVKWTLFARGLHEPLGMFYKDGSLYLTQRPEVTKLTDTDGDGRADKFETITHHWGIDGDYHEYNFGSDPDPKGDIWVVHCLTGSGGASDKSPWRGWCYRYNLDGTATPTCPGIRSPGGIGFNAAGDCFYTDNQGLWNGSSSLKWLKPGGFMGNPTGNKYVKLTEGLEEPPNPKSGSRMVTEHDKDPRIIPPAVILPHGKVGQSPTAVIYDNTDGKFGPFKNQVLVGEQTHSQVQRVYLEKVKGYYQGAVWKFLEDFRCGTIPARMGEDATLFVGGSNRGWAARGGKNFNFERVRWTGKTPFEMHEMHAKTDGFVITFTEPVDAATAKDSASYQAAAWTYIYQSNYGSPEVDKATPKIDSITLAPDKKSVHLKVSGRVRGHVHHFNLSGVKSANGDSLWHPDVYYTLNEIPD